MVVLYLDGYKMRCPDCARIMYQGMGCPVPSCPQHEKADPNYCGLGDINTGPEDPYWKTTCEPHDLGFDRAIEGTQGRKDSVYTNGKLVVDAIKTAGVKVGQAAWALAELPFIIAIGGLGGIFRWAAVVKKPTNNEKSEKTEL